jgi:hypothetical protein
VKSKTNPEKILEVLKRGGGLLKKPGEFFEHLSSAILHYTL